MTNIDFERLLKTLESCRDEFVDGCLENLESPSFRSDTDYIQTIALISIAQSLEKIAAKQQ